MADKTILHIEGKEVPVTNLGKVFYPKTGFTKGEIIDYYIRISKVLLPHLKGRPISLKRYPDGVEGFFFYEKQCPSHRPKWVKTASAEKKDGGEVSYCVMDDLPALVWAANLADLELHTFLHKAPAMHRPTALAFDLDPGAPADIIQCCETALVLRGLFDGLGLKCFPKTSGSKGMQLYVPLNTAVTYEKTKAFAHAIAQLLEKQFPEKITSQMKKGVRLGKVFIDWSQNDEKKTTVTVYSLRAKERPSVSTPLQWEEVEAALKRGKGDQLFFDPDTVVKRVEKHGDLFRPVLELKQKLPAIPSVAKAV